MLRRIIDSIQILVVPRGRDRLAAVQIRFVDGERCRDYLILHRPPKSNGKAAQEGKSLKCSFADTALADDLDLRQPADVKQVAELLENIDLLALENATQTKESRV